MADHNLNPGKRKAQHLLASEVLELVHGREEASKTQAEHQAMRNPSFSSGSEHKSNSNESTSGSQQQRMILGRSQVQGIPLYRVLHNAGLAATKSEAARLVSTGGVYVATKSSGNGQSGSGEETSFVQLKDSQAVDVDQFLVNDQLILRLGKWKVRVIQVVENGGIGGQKKETAVHGMSL